MSIYIINKQTIFNDIDGTLKYVGDDDPAHTLSVPTRRLFLYLIIHNGENLSREDILREVWEKNGLVSSNNNLNHNISNLRKSLATMNEKDLILTLPKFGFRLHADIEQEENAAPLPVNETGFTTDADTVSFSGNTVTKMNAPRYTRKLNIWQAVCLTALTVCILISMTFYIYNQENAVDIPPKILLGTIGKCDIYQLGSHSAKQKMRLLAMAKTNIARFSLDCDVPSDIYFSGVEINLQPAIVEIDTIYYCSRETSNKNLNDSCFNILFNNWSYNEKG